MPKYSVTTEGPDDRLPVLRHCWIVWRVGAGGKPEAHGVFATEEAAKADPVGGAHEVVGWKIARTPLIGWNAIALKGG
jgi:hypothetical protein